MTENDLICLMSMLKKGEYGYILRAKGRVKTKEKGWLHFDYTPYISKYKEAIGSAPGGETVVIGCGLDRTALKNLFKQKEQ